MNVLGISGSLRKASLNSMLLRAAAQLTPPTMNLRVYPSLDGIPLFNPDIESSDPEPVRKLREAICGADALIIASPEYAHGITGVMKNALDWMVGTEAFVYKPVAIFNASPRSLHADSALREVLGVMSASIIETASISIQIRGSGLDEQAIVRDAEKSANIRQALESLANAISPLEVSPVSQGEFDVEVIDRIVTVRVRGEPSKELIEACHARVLEVSRLNAITAVLYDARAMQAPTIDVPWTQRTLDEQAQPDLKRAIVVPDAKLAFLARVAFGENDRVFYNDVSGAIRWLQS
jgi:chromate reductase, NAD(P)H dehydrogenase (quinone)